MRIVMDRKPKILFLFSDTGGGHRSAAESIIEAIHLEFPDQYETKMIDIFREYAPLPLNFAPEIYPHLSRYPRMWKIGYKLSDEPKRMKIFYDAMWPYLRRAVHNLFRENQVDLMVSVHQLVNIPLMRARLKNNVKFVTVVTDLVSTHSSWYHPGADLVIVPTIPAKEKALRNGLPIEKIQVIGQPIADKYLRRSKSKIELRESFGWEQDLITILLVGGGEGMGNLEQHAYAINQSKLPVQLVIVAGRNQALKQKLENEKWKFPVHVYGFVDQMPEFMQAADILLTKAGPGTISESFIAGLPLLLYSRMPGQEDGNIGYVVNQNAGYWVPDPGQMINCLKKWVDKPEELIKVAARSKQLAKPNASREIARELIWQISPSDVNRTWISV